MDGPSNFLTHSAGLSLYPAISSSSPGVQDSLTARSALTASGQNGWGGYGNESLIHHGNMPSYPNLQFGPPFPVNTKAAAYNAFANGDYINNCRQMQISSLGGLNGMSRYHPGIYGEMYPTGHHSTYTNGCFYPDIGAGLPPLPGRELSCSSTQSDTSSPGEFTSCCYFVVRINFLFVLC
ncbi:hypothetical protein BsWGS_09296 [Bradybaena similaris]